MNSSIFVWKGLETISLEHCFLKRIESGYEVRSVIIGMQHKIAFRTEYLIKANDLWETSSMEISTLIGDAQNKHVLSTEGKGNWILDGEAAPQLKGCCDVDITLTPFTNTLSINRLQLKTHETQMIRVVYYDVFLNDLRIAIQKYTKTSETGYHFQNVPNDFETEIEVDPDGIVVFYPSLFERLIATNTI